MLKISEGKQADQPVTLRLEGRIVSEWVGELQTISERLLNDSGRMALDLAGVSYVDERGLALLVGLRSRGVRLQNVTLFLEEQLKSAGARSQG